MKSKNSGREILENAKRFEKALGEFVRIIRLKNPSSFSNVHITGPQFATLVYLSRDNNCTMGRLKENLDLSLSTLTGIVDRMIKAGYVERQRDGNDRRVVRVRMTKKGEEVSKELNKKRHKKIITILQLLKREDQELLIGTFERLTSHLVQNSKAELLTH